MPDPRWTLLVHSGGADEADACLAAARAGATVLRYGGGAVQAVEAALRSFQRGSADGDGAFDGLITDGRTLRSAGDGRWGAVALDAHGHLAAGGWGDHHADDAVGAASVLGASTAGRIVRALEEGAEPRAAVVGTEAAAVALDRRGRIGVAPGSGAVAIAGERGEPRLITAAQELMNG